MEKFAVDLDKVLDDFELEDENECSSHYDKLQLEFCDHQEEACAESIQNNYETGANNWLASVSEVIPGTRSPPDGQHDDQSVSDLSLLNSSSVNTLKEDLLCDLTTEPVLDNSCKPLVNGRQEKDSSYSSFLQNDLLWPQFSSGNLEVSTAEREPDNVAQIPTSYVHTVDSDNSKRSSDTSRLDVLPKDSAPPPDVSNNQEGNHPDIIDVAQNNMGMSVPLECDIQGAEGGFNFIDEQNSTAVTDLVSSTQHETVLLPDLFSNTACLPEQSPPAVVTENLLSHVLIEPAIILESQATNRLPEVTNVHQSAEIQFMQRENINDQYEIPTTEDEHESFIEASMPSELVDHVTLYEPQRLPDVSMDCTDNSRKAIAHNEANLNPIKFDPDMQIDECELAISIDELEAELGHPVLGSNANESAEILPIGSHTDEHNLVCIKEISDNKTENVVEAKASLKGTGTSKDPETLNVSSISPFSEYQPTESSMIPSINTLEVCGTSSSSHPANIIDQPYDSINPTDMAEESSSGSSGTDTTSSSSTLVGDFDSNDNENFSVPTAPQEEESNESEDPKQSIGEEIPEGADEENYSSALEPTALNPAVGTVAPFWVPDKDAANCQECGAKFTMIRRRHHCRACGRVLCSFCCHSKAPLPYLDFKEERVCETCLLLLTEASSRDEIGVVEEIANRQPNPNNPMEYCSRIPPPQQVAASAGIASLPTVMVPVGILKRDHANYRGPNSGRARANKQVIFMDGIQPGGDLSELGTASQQPSSAYRRGDRSSRSMVPALPGDVSVKRGRRRLEKQGEKLSAHSADGCLIPRGGLLPPVLLSSPYDGEYKFDQSPDSQKLEEQLQGDGPPVVFAIIKNFSVLVKKITLSCCIGKEVWNVATRGLCAVGQDELVVLIEALPEERAPPAQLFTFFYSVYQQANKGNLVTELGHTIYTEPDGFLGSKDHAGFLYIKPSFQCLNKLLLPPAPYIFAVLIQKWETPWAKVFPLRLMLRLGADSRYYPCPLVSVRNRKPVFGEIGHTIMNLLVDFRNYTYTIPLIQGFTIHMEDKKTTLLIPRNRYEQVCKALDNSNDHVLALVANFSPLADSHLVTVEDDDGNYSTQAINIHNRPRKVTGASFIVFNGALKSTSGLKGKSSIVEDGLMVQIHGDMMTSLRDALRNLNDFDVQCGKSSAPEPEEVVLIRWTEDDKSFNVGIRSAVDDRAMDGVPSIKVHSVPDYASKYHIIRWTEIFIIQEENANGNSDINISRLSEGLSRACCVALIPHLHELFATGQTKVALRTTLHQENVEYEIGSGGVHLPPSFMNSLDTELIPIIHQSAANIMDQPVILELVFHILEQ